MTISPHHYNPWPLGRLSKELQRPEPELIRELGYSWDDPRDINSLFEKELASFAGSKFAVLTDSCTHALFLSLKRRQVTGKVMIPAQTYVSVPAQILHAGGTPVFTDLKWSGFYELGDTGVFDSAARFTAGMYVPDSLYCLSFQIKKILPIGRGGAILTDSIEDYEWLRRAAYDGRDLLTPYDDETHVNSAGWHFYMTPEDAARGLFLMSKIPKSNPDSMNFSHYPNLTLWQPYKSLQYEKTESI